jgi:hypothetical protein
MVGRGDEDGVNVLPGKQVAIVAEARAPFVLVLLIYLVARSFEICLGHITDRDHLRIRLSKEAGHITPSLWAESDTAECDPIAGGYLPSVPKAEAGMIAGTVAVANAAARLL